MRSEVSTWSHLIETIDPETVATSDYCSDLDNEASERIPQNVHQR